MSVEGDQLTCRVTDAYGRPDALVPSRTFAFQLIWEAWLWLSKGAVLFEAKAGLNRTKAKRLAKVAPIGQEVAGHDICDGDWTRANVKQFVRRVKVRDRYHEDKRFWHAPRAERPQATYVIMVTDPRWLSHMVPGLEWETTAYDKDEKD
jgi:hypothetical protein